MVMSALVRRASKSSGVHYTPRVLARYLSKEISQQLRARDLGAIRVLDPAVGDGELLSALLDEVTVDGKIIEAVGFDTDKKSIDIAIDRLSRQCPNVRLDLRQADFLELALANFGAATLFSHSEIAPELFDVVIANPPYVRTQVLGSSKSQSLTHAYKLSGRVDLYHAFIKGIASVLKPGGIAGIIVSNRFMTTRAGVSTRLGIAEKFDILRIWDLGDTRVFEAAVLPAVLLLRRKGPENVRSERRFTSIYRIDTGAKAEPVDDPIDALRCNGFVRTNDGEALEVRHGSLEFGSDPSGVWRLSTSRSDRWLATVLSNTYCTFADVGKVRVGVKTTADKIFIRTDWSVLGRDKLPELLRPLTTHHIARRYKALEEIPTRQILYPHEVSDGCRRPVDLGEFPNSRRYLEGNRSALEDRKYLNAAGRRWYEIWVPQDPEAWGRPKVIFRDISEHPTFWMDLKGTVVNGDCYWIGMDTQLGVGNDLLWLILAVANSRFIEMFYDHRFHNKLYSGRRRFMTQYVEAFPLPDPNTEKSRQLIEAAKNIFSGLPERPMTREETEIEALVHESFGLKAEGFQPTESQLVVGSEASY